MPDGERPKIHDLDTAEVGDDRGDALAGQFLPGFEMDEVVGKAGGKHDQGGWKQFDDKD